MASPTAFARQQQIGENNGPYNKSPQLRSKQYNKNGRDVFQFQNMEKCDPMAPPKYAHECICDRPKATVACRSCGKSYIGRARFMCGRHPNRIQLMDLEFCPSCHAPACSLIEKPLCSTDSTEN